MSTIINNNDVRLTVNYRGPAGKFAALDTAELVEALKRRFPKWEIKKTDYAVRTKKAMEFYPETNATGVETQRSGGTRSYIEMLSPSLLPGINDKVKGRILIKDQDFSGAALTVSFGLYRLVCTNGLMAFSDVAAPLRIPHHKNRADLLMQLDRIIESSAALFDRVAEQATVLQATRIANPINTVQQLNLPKTLVERVVRVLELNAQRPEDNVNTVYGLYNLINEIDRRSARRNSTAWIERDVQLVQQLTNQATAA